MIDFVYFDSIFHFHPFSYFTKNTKMPKIKTNRKKKVKNLKEKEKHFYLPKTI
jgi:hypothetical protein